MPTIEGHLIKMPVTLAEPVAYTLQCDDHKIDLNALLGKSISLTYTGVIHCVACGRKTNKSFSQGHCFPCFRSLASCDSCIVKPELCHFAQGTCRQPEWGEAHCMKAHVVYLSHTSGIKVGVTRRANIPTRWIDQGATQAIEVFEVDQRLHAGQLEVTLKSWFADKTNWRAMLKGNQPPIDLIAARNDLLDRINGDYAIYGPTTVSDAPAVEINYPVLSFPEKVSSRSFDKTPVVEGTLMGIKGQYLILDTGVINIRKFAGYHVQCQYEE